MDQCRLGRRRWHILGVMGISLFVIVLDNTVLNLALKTIAEPHGGLGASQSELEWAVNSYTLAFAGLLLTAGVLGDRLGRKRVLAAGLALFGTASLLCAYSRSPGQLIATRAAMGLGGALVMPQTLSIITNVFEPAERPRALGIWAGAVGLAVAIGPATGGLLLSRFWWGSIFLINIPIVATALAGLILIVPESRNPHPGRIDIAGILLSVAGLALLCYGIIQGGDAGDWASRDTLAPLAAGLVLLGLFACCEARIRHPSLDVRLFRDARLCCAVAAIALVFFSLSGVLFVTSFYLQDVRLYAPWQAGLMMLPFAAGQLIFAPRSAAMISRFGAKVVCTAGLLQIAGACAGCGFMGVSSPIWVFGASFFVLGAGIVTIMPSANECLMSALPRTQAGSGSGINSTARQVAEALGVAVAGSILQNVYRGQMDPRLGFLPAAARKPASESIGGTMAIVRQLGPAGARLAGPARTAFVGGMHVALTMASVAALVGGAVMFTWMPGSRHGVCGRAASAGRQALRVNTPALFVRINGNKALYGSAASSRCRRARGRS